MISVSVPADHAVAAYEAMAPYYDAFTADLDHAVWVPVLDRLARAAGADGGTVLDVACGTGKSFTPFTTLGWTVDGCDLTPGMLARARARGGARSLWLADMRELPTWRAYDLVVCLDDALNYLLSDAELRNAFAGFARNLRQGGVLVFDLNTLYAYATFFTRPHVMETPGEVVICEGLARRDPPPGSRASLRITHFAETEAGEWRRAVADHHERHHPAQTVARLLDTAGFELLDAHGQDHHAVLQGPLDEAVHWKSLWVARRL